MSLGWWMIYIGFISVMITGIRVVWNLYLARTGRTSEKDGFETHMAYGVIMALSIFAVIIGIVVLFWYGGK